VKYREKIRPLAPIVQYEKAEAYFVFPKSSDLIDRSSYENMTIAVKAKEVTKQKLPACVHVDGTSRVQLLRKETNPLVYDFLSELEKLTGHPVSVNTSFNVGSPIVHSPAQAIKAFLKAKGMDGVIFVSVEGDVFAMYRKGARSKLKESIDRLSKKP
jgi:carbamoyltransferase